MHIVIAYSFVRVQRFLNIFCLSPPVRHFGGRDALCLPCMGSLISIFPLSLAANRQKLPKSLSHPRAAFFSHPLDFQALFPGWLSCRVLLCPSQHDSEAAERGREALDSLCKRLFSFPTKNGWSTAEKQDLPFLDLCCLGARCDYL